MSSANQEDYCCTLEHLHTKAGNSMQDLVMLINDKGVYSVGNCAIPISRLLFKTHR